MTTTAKFSILPMLVVRDGESRELRVLLERDGDTWEARVTSADGTVHATGQVAYVEAEAEVAVSLDGIAAECEIRRESYESAADEHLDFGPRWNNRVSAAFGASPPTGRAGQTTDAIRSSETVNADV